MQGLIMALLLLVSLNAGAEKVLVSIEAVEPKEICARFNGLRSKTECLKLATDPSADAYLAAVCEKQVDDQAFFDCLKLSALFEYDPKRIQACGSADLEDQDRLTCLNTAGRPWSKTSARLPANATAKKKSKSTRTSR